MSEKEANVITHEVEEDPREKLTPVEEAMLKRMSGEEEQAQEEEVSVEGTEKDNEEEQPTEPKESYGDLLSKNMGISAEESVNDDDPEIIKGKLTEAQKKLKVIEESEKLEGLIGKLPEHEKTLVEQGVEDLIRNGVYADLNHLPTDKKLAMLVSQARGYMKDKIDEVSKETLSKQRSNEAIIKTNTKPAKATPPQDERLAELRRLAREGDRSAGIELAGYDPVLDRITREDLG